MSFFGKVKQFFGAGTIKVELAVPAQVAKSSGQLAGRVTLNALSDQEVLELTVCLKESWHTGRGENREEKEFELGKIKLADTFGIRQHESRLFDFVLPFTLLKSGNDRLMEAGGALGFLGKAAAFADAEHSHYHVVAEADVKGALLDPSDKKQIQLL
jgi:hypothetical protein